MVMIFAAIFSATSAIGATRTSPQMQADNVRLETFTTHQRPPVNERLFTSKAVEAEIERIKAIITHDKLRRMFENCFPNTLDTTVHYRVGEDGLDDTFVYTGDIHAMWLRDSGAQVWPYVRLADRDEELRRLLAGVIRRQLRCIILDPYANAFNDGPAPTEWANDRTRMIPELHERKWEIDSLCYPIRLAYHYWKTTGDTSVFDEEWLQAIELVLQTFREQQRKENRGPYRFQRRTERASDTMINDGWGAPVNPVGLIASAFRPSDDATMLLFLIPSNFFAVQSLRKAAEILQTVNGRADLAESCLTLAQEVEDALKEYAVAHHKNHGDIYAYEVDGFGTQILMDDANVPSLLSLGYLDPAMMDDPIYQNTRRYVWSTDNPYFFRGTAGEGVGSPHTSFDLIWPMSIIMKAMTSTCDDEIRRCIQMLVDTDAGTEFMHEAFNKNNPDRFTRSWFAWVNTLFGELLIKLIDEGKADVVNSID